MALKRKALFKGNFGEGRPVQSIYHPTTHPSKLRSSGATEEEKKMAFIPRHGSKCSVEEGSQGVALGQVTDFTSLRGQSKALVSYVSIDAQIPQGIVFVRV